MNNELNVLLIEDDDVAAESVVRSIRKNTSDVKISIAENGQDGLDLLNKKNGEFYPDIILLDLNMPVMNGFEFLETIRNDEGLKDLVVFVLTTSNEDSDRTKAYHHNVAGFMVKSAVGPQFSKLANLLSSYKSAVELNRQRPA